MNYAQSKQTYDYQRYVGNRKKKGKTRTSSTVTYKQSTQPAQPLYTAESAMAEYNAWLSAQNPEAPVEAPAEAPVVETPVAEAPVVEAPVKKTKKAKQEPKKEEIPVLEKRTFDPVAAHDRQAELNRQHAERAGTYEEVPFEQKPVDSRIFNEQDAQKQMEELREKHEERDRINKERRNIHAKGAMEAREYQTRSELPERQSKHAYTPDSQRTRDVLGMADPNEALTQLANERRASNPDVIEAQGLVDKEKFTKKDRQRAEEILSKYENSIDTDPAIRDLYSRVAYDSKPVAFGAGAVDQLGRRYYVADKLASKASGGRTLAERTAAADPAYNVNQIMANNAENSGDAATAEAYRQAMANMAEQADFGNMIDDASRDHRYAYGAGKTAAILGENAAIGNLFGEAGYVAKTGNKVVDFFANQGIKSIPDVLADTIPTLAEAYDEGKRGADLALKGLANYGVNVGLNTGTEYIPKAAKWAWDKVNGTVDPDFLAGLRKYGDEVLHPLAEDTDNIARGALNAQDLARQNAEGIGDVIAQRNAAADEMERLAQQIPEQPKADLIPEMPKQEAKTIPGIADEVAPAKAVENAVSDETAPLEEFVQRYNRLFGDTTTPEVVKGFERDLTNVEQLPQMFESSIRKQMAKTSDPNVIAEGEWLIDQAYKQADALRRPAEVSADDINIPERFGMWDNPGYQFSEDALREEAEGNIIGLSRGAERSVTREAIAEAINEATSTQRFVRNMLKKYDMSSSPKLAQEAGEIEKYMQEMIDAVSRADLDAATEAKRLLNNARSRFHTAAKKLPDYDGSFNTKEFSNMLGRPEYVLRKGSAPVKTEDEVWHMYEEKQWIDDRRKAVNNLLDEVEKRVRNNPEAAERLSKFLDDVHNVEMDNSEEAAKALQDSFGAIQGDLTEPVPQEALEAFGNEVKVNHKNPLKLDLQFFAQKNADDVAEEAGKVLADDTGLRNNNPTLTGRAETTITPEDILRDEPQNPRMQEIDDQLARIDERLKQYETPTENSSAEMYRAEIRALDNQIADIEANGISLDVPGEDARLSQHDVNQVLSDLRVRREQARQNLENITSTDITDAVSGNNRRQLETAREKLIKERDALAGGGNGGRPPKNPPEDIPNGGRIPPENPTDGGGIIPPETPPTDGANNTRISKARTNTYERLGYGDAMPREDYRYKVYGEEAQKNDAIARYQNSQNVVADLLGKNDNDFDEVDVKMAFSEMQRLMDQGDPQSLQMANLLGRKSAAAQREGGRVVQASAEYTKNTAAGALQDANTALENLTLQPWKSRNKKMVEGNSRIARALADMGNKWKNTNGKPALTHDQIKKGVVAELEREVGSVEKHFNDNDIEYLTRLAEDKTVPVWKITDEIEHKLKHGTWYTLDESLPEGPAKKNKSLSRMLDHIMNGEAEAKTKKEPTIGELLSGIKNTLNDESAGVADLFNDDDYYFIAKMMEEKVPRWQIEEELRHKLEHGSWFNLDESIPVKQPTNKKLQAAMNSLVTEKVRGEAPKPTIQQITEEVRNTLGKEFASIDGDFSDDDIQYIANMINNGATQSEIADALSLKAATGNFGISGETMKEVNNIFKQISRFDPDSKQFVEGQARAYELLADEILPNATLAEKFEAWRYLAMLGNPKTMLRNYIGNKTFGAVTGISNNIAAMAEAGVDRAVKAMGGNGIQRTKAVLNPVADSGLIKAAADYGDASSYRQMMGTKYEKMNADNLRRHKSVFNSKLAQLYEKATDAGISDYSAVKQKFSTSLAGYLKANGYGEEIFKAEDQLARLRGLGENRLLTNAERAEIESLSKDIEVLNKAREYALKQAEYATFHEDNKVAQMLSEWSRSSKERGTGLGHLIIEGLVPFKKTPANVLRSGIEYSPLGAIDSIRKTGKLIYENTGKNAGNLADTYMKNGKEVQKTLAADVIDSWSKTLTGTGLAALGYYLYNKGILHSSDPDTKYQDQLEGHQNYAIEINGKSYTIDWAAPSIMPLMIGAEVAKLWPTIGKSTGDFYDNIDKLFAAANRIADPIIETSMLSGIQDALETASNAARNNENLNIPALLLWNTATGYATQGVPTAAGQIARTIDPTRRSTYTDKEGVAGVLDKQLKKQMNKIPFLSMLNEPYIDTYGRTQQNSPFDNPALNLAYQAVSPGYLADINETDADRISREAYEASDGGTNMLPNWPTGLKMDGERVDPETYTQYMQAEGEAQKTIRDALANSEWFNDQSPENRAEIVGKINSLANNIGKSAVDPEFTSTDGMYKAYKEGGIDGLMDYVSTKYNPYGIDQKAYSDMSKKGEDMSKYEGYGEALDDRKLDDKEAYRKAWSEGGEQGLDEYLEKENNPYGLKADAYQKMLDEGEDLTKYEGYGEALEKNGVEDKEAYRHAWIQGKEQAVAKEAEYQSALNDADVDDSKANKTIWQNAKKKGEDPIEALKEFDQARRAATDSKGDRTIDSVLAYANSTPGVKKETLEMLAPANASGTWQWSGGQWHYFNKDGKERESKQVYEPLEKLGMSGKMATQESYDRAHKALPELTPGKYASMISLMDTNKNGEVSMDEAVNYMNKYGIPQLKAPAYWEGLGFSDSSTNVVYSNGQYKKKRKKK